MFAHADPLFKNLHILKAEDISKIQQFKLYYKYLKHTLPTFFLNLQFRTSEHYYSTTVFVIFLGAMFVVQFNNICLCITTNFPSF